MHHKLKYFKKLINDYLRKVLSNKHLPRYTHFSNKIYQCMRYAVFPGGKRLRPLLTLATAETCSISSKMVLPLAAAIELIHCYSLVHDDLPSMDNDDYRRGKLTVHKKFSEGLAILTGDALLTKAFELLSIQSQNVAQPFRIENALQAINFIAKSIGANGMIAGQVVDTFVNNEYISKSHRKKLLNYIHLNKTAKLIQASVISAAIVANVPKKEFNALKNYSRKIGSAFQIIDDILDKSQDNKSKKLTYPMCYGIKNSTIKAYKLIKEAKSKLNVFGKKAKLLREIADYVLTPLTPL